MKFSLPGQLRGPECKSVIQEAISLREELEPIFNELQPEHISELSICLRVNGSLGTFGPEGIESIELKNQIIECELVVGNHNWANLHAHEVSSILRPLVYQAINESLQRNGVSHKNDLFNGLLSSDT